MFTGLVREIGILRGMARRGGVLRLDIAAPDTADRVQVGDSVAVQGICLTVTGVGRGTFSVEAAAETRRLTTLGRWRRGRRLHLEPSLRAGDALDGHLVQGHVDGRGRVVSLRRAPGGGRFLTISLAPELARYLVPRGSIAVDGVSLTIAGETSRRAFDVNLIPHTLKTTNFAGLRAGTPVNLEMDVLVKAAAAGRVDDWPEMVSGAAAKNSPGTPLSVRRLRELGFGRWHRKGER